MKDTESPRVQPAEESRPPRLEIDSAGDFTLSDGILSVTDATAETAVVVSSAATTQDSVTVTANGNRVSVKLVDWCGSADKLIDLYAAPFSRLAPLSQGIVTVIVRW